MDIRYNISQLFEIAFGFRNPFFFPAPIRAFESGKPVNYTLPSESDQQPGITFNAPAAGNDGEVTRASWMGTPIMFPVTFQGGLYKAYDATGDLTDFQIEDFELPAASLIDFTRAKNIIRTEVLGNEGTVKELYSFGDWAIHVRGLCLADDARRQDRTAAQQKQRLLELERVAGSIRVVGELFGEKAIDDIVIESVNIQQIEGKPHVYKFEMTCISDLAAELRVP